MPQNARQRNDIFGVPANPAGSALIENKPRPAWKKVKARCTEVARQAGISQLDEVAGIAQAGCSNLIFLSRRSIFASSVGEA